MPKKRLMTPGPTQVPEEALLALARQVGHHRTPEFKALFQEVLDGLRYVLQTKNDVVVLASSGTGAMEAAMVNLVPRGGKAIVLEAGVFAKRWRDIGEAFGIQVVTHSVAWGDAVQPADVARLLAEHPDAVAVFGTLQESSTGVAHDIRGIAEVVAPHSALLVVDGISGVGVQECRADAWGIDVVVVGSQKALMLPPGLAVVSVSEAAWKQMEQVKPQAFYFDLKVHRKKLHDGPDTPWTPAHTLIAALAETLKLIRAQGIESIWQRSNRMARATRAGLTALGIELLANRPADGLTSAWLPEGVDGSAFTKRLESRFGVKVAGGQGHLKGKIFRIAHMGIVDELDIVATLAAIELVLDELGRPVEFGSGVAAASQVFAETHSAKSLA